MNLEGLSIERDLFHGKSYRDLAVLFSITGSWLAKPAINFVATRATNYRVENWSAKHHEVNFNKVLQEPITAPFVTQQDIRGKSNPPCLLEFLSLDYCKWKRIPFASC